MKARWYGNHTAHGMRPLLLMLVIALVLLVVMPASALAYKATSWTGSVGSSWNTDGNWTNGVPAATDDLTISGSAPMYSYNDIDSATLGAVGAVNLSGTLTVAGGYPLLMNGPFTVSGSPLWNLDTGLATNLTTSVASGASPVFGSTFDMHPDLYEASQLTMQVGSGATAYEQGSMIGVGPDCKLVKKGSGELRLGWGGSSGSAWTGANTYQGSTDVQAGTLTFWNPGTLPEGTELDIASGATVAAHFGVAGHGSDTWNNSIVGSGDLDVDAGSLTIDGDTNYSGTATVASGATLTVSDHELSYLGGDVVLKGTLRGLGGLSTLDVRSGGVVSPGVNDYEPASIWPGTNLKLRGGGSYTVDIQDIWNGNWDYLQQSDTGSSTTVYATEANPFTIKLRTCQNGVPGNMADFDPGQEYHWPVIYCPNLSGFDPTDFVVDTSQFTNDFGEGKFSVAHNTDTDEIEVVYSPVEPPIITGTDLASTTDAAAWQTVSPATWYVEAMDRQGDSMTLNYQIDGDTTTTYTEPLSTQSGHTDKVAFGQCDLEGLHSVDAWVTDVHGYPSDHITGYVKLDSVDPSVDETSNYLSSSSSTWNKVDLTAPNGPATLAATDATSGVASIQYRVQTGGTWGSWTTYDSNGITVTGEGAHAVQYRATDVAGNVSNAKTRYYNIDKTSPVLTFGTHNPYYGTRNVTFTWSATDNLAPAGDLRYQYKLVPPGQTESSVPYNAENTDLTVTYGTSGSPLAAGVYTFYCKVRDDAGNWDTESFSFEVKQFTITPSASANGSISPASIVTVDYGDSQTFTISANAHYHVADVKVDGSS
ncbi:MAG TPA: autotransporter-associated beta strand repeat-containing protein, partial [Thermoleophilia bacterium]|nr:autotransporter-associated beta strand repeat-containing protein [Thermoleophilia bacterium]